MSAAALKSIWDTCAFSSPSSPWWPTTSISLNRARTSTRQAADALHAGVSLDLVAMDLRIAANAVGEIVGKTSTEDLLDSIFSTFCIGK